MLRFFLALVGVSGLPVLLTLFGLMPNPSHGEARARLAVRPAVMDRTDTEALNARIDDLQERVFLLNRELAASIREIERGLTTTVSKK